MTEYGERNHKLPKRRTFVMTNLLQSALQPLVGFWPAQLSFSILSRKFLESAVASGTSNPNLEVNQGFKAFQLSPQEAPSFWSDASEPSNGRWNYGREMVEKFCRKWRLPRHFWVFLHAVKHDMGQTALLPLRRKACWGFFLPKNPTASAGFEPANLGTEGQHATSRPPIVMTNTTDNIRLKSDIAKEKCSKNVKKKTVKIIAF
jgi:hypothetical protein